MRDYCFHKNPATGLMSVLRAWSLQEHACRVSKYIHDDTLEERLQIQFFGDMRRASVKLDGKVLAAKVERGWCVSLGGGAGVCM